MDSGWSWSPRQTLAQLNNNALGGNKQALPPLPPMDPRFPMPSNENARHVTMSSHCVPRALVPPVVGAAAHTPAAPATATASTSRSRKRKSSDGVEDGRQNLFPTDVPDIDDDDPRLEANLETCNAVRRKIRNWIESGAMKVGEFQNMLGVSSKAYLSFMNRTGTWDGTNCDTYAKAHDFFRRRELQGLPIKLDKPKKARTVASVQKAAAALDVGDTTLPREDTDKVPVYDTCDEVRRKIRALLQTDGVTNTAFCREASKAFHDGRKVSAANLRYFLGQKGPLSGNTNTAFYGAYVFFEKRRVRDGKPKTKFREEMERVHGAKGVDREHGANTTSFFCFGNERPYVDKYARFQFTGRR